MRPIFGTRFSIGRNREAFCSRLGRRRHSRHASNSCSGIFMLEDATNSFENNKCVIAEELPFVAVL